MTERSYRIVRRNHCDDFLTAEGLYFRSRGEGGLIFFSGHGVGMGTYGPEDWVEVYNVTGNPSTSALGTEPKAQSPQSNNKGGETNG